MPTSEHIKKKQPFESYETLLGEVREAKPLEVEVFGYNHKKVADDLYKCLFEGGFLTKHPLFRVRVDTMDGYTLNDVKTPKNKRK